MTALEFITSTQGTEAEVIAATAQALENGTLTLTGILHEYDPKTVAANLTAN